MGFRITTNMMMNTYRYNLQGSTKKLSDARDMVLTQRKFSSYADDPAAATLAFRLRRDYLQTSSYLTNTKDVYSKFNTAWHNLGGVVDDLGKTARDSAIRGVTGTAGKSRSALAIDLRETAESVVQALNQKLGDHFIFGGNDALNPPFSWSKDMKTLYYRGVNVNAGNVKKPADFPVTDEDKFDENGNLKVNELSEDEINEILAGDQKWIDYYNDQVDLDKLQRMSGEEMYIDLGMGAAETSPNSPVKGTYFNSALCGIDFLGFGVDEDGDPLNLALIMREMADVFDTWDEDGDPQGYNPELAKDTAVGLSREELTEKASRLLDKLQAALNNTSEHWVELDAQSVYLQSNQALLETQQTDLNIQILDVEQVDLAEAITTFSWEQYCYNAALKIGNQLLSQSLIDYMS